MIGKKKRWIRRKWRGRRKCITRNQSSVELKTYVDQDPARREDCKGEKEAKGKRKSRGREGKGRVSEIWDSLVRNVSCTVFVTVVGEMVNTEWAMWKNVLVGGVGVSVCGGGVEGGRGMSVKGQEDNGLCVSLWYFFKALFWFWRVMELMVLLLLMLLVE